MRVSLFIAALLLGLALSSCERREGAGQPPPPVAIVPPVPAAGPVSSWRIERRQVGPFRVRHRVSEYAALLADFTVDTVEAWNWGYDGGGHALLVRQGADSLLALVPYEGTDSIIGISLLTPALRAANGVRVGVTVRELLAIYPKLRVEVNALSEGETSTDPANDWTFEFYADAARTHQTIGRYRQPYDSGETVPPTNLDAHLDRIIVQ